MAARYRKVDPRFWKDEKVRRMAPEEKLIAVYAFTAQSNRIGCFTFSPAMAIEDLGLKPETFAERFGNVCRTLAWGWDSGPQVLYLPTWWKYNQPENKNNMIGNLKDLDDLPSSPLVSAFCANTEYLQNGLAKTFTETLAERYPKRLASQEQVAGAGAGSREQENLGEVPSPIIAPEKTLTPQQAFVKAAMEEYANVGAVPPAAALLCKWTRDYLKGQYDWTLRELKTLGAAGHLSLGPAYVSKALQNIGNGNRQGVPAKMPDTRKWNKIEETL